MDAILSELLKLISGLIIAVLASFITVRLAIRRFRQEQWWTRKADSYTAVFVALHEMKKFLRATEEDQIGNVAQGPDRLDELAKGWTRGNDELAKAVDLGLLVFSPSAVQGLEELQRRLAQESINDFSWEHIQARVALLDQCLVTLRKVARTDLALTESP